MSVLMDNCCGCEPSARCSRHVVARLNFRGFRPFTSIYPDPSDYAHVYRRVDWHVDFQPWCSIPGPELDRVRIVLAGSAEFNTDGALVWNHVLMDGYGDVYRYSVDAAGNETTEENVPVYDESCAFYEDSLHNIICAYNDQGLWGWTRREFVGLSEDSLLVEYYGPTNTADEALIGTVSALLTSDYPESAQYDALRAACEIPRDGAAVWVYGGGDPATAEPRVVRCADAEGYDPATCVPPNLYAVRDWPRNRYVYQPLGELDMPIGLHDRRLTGDLVWARFLPDVIEMGAIEAMGIHSDHYWGDASRPRRAVRVWWPYTLHGPAPVEDRACSDPVWKSGREELPVPPAMGRLFYDVACPDSPPTYPE